ncbi:MAG TPA: hypothetical protein VN512_02300 [Clostridia bacterium]|nr:hypothetical protein [Clostridia bacterium]
MCEKKETEATEREIGLEQDILFEEAVCSHEFSEGCKEPSER